MSSWLAHWTGVAVISVPFHGTIKDFCGIDLNNCFLCRFSWYCLDNLTVFISLSATLVILWQQ